ncbi:MAG: hypothetical protein Q4F44_08810, partial [Bacteroidales bacterium]|nr:hypothetical protein [Bacteroidales bacterium]
FRTKVRNPKNKIGSKCQKSLILGTGTLKHHLQAMDSVQDYLGMADKGLSNLEFQEHVLKDLYNYSYQKTETKNFDYKWEYMLKILEIPYNKL